MSAQILRGNTSAVYINCHFVPVFEYVSLNEESKKQKTIKKFFLISINLFKQKKIVHDDDDDGNNKRDFFVFFY